MVATGVRLERVDDCGEVVPRCACEEIDRSGSSAAPSAVSSSLPASKGLAR
jgi:hypothetical protein